MGYRWKTERRGQFADGHEREDVVDFRMNNFIPKWSKIEPRMTTWDKDGNAILPKLARGEKEVVAHFHDEVIYKAHDRRMTRWVHEGETAGLYKKGEGMSLMVADLVSAKYGFLRRPSDSGGNKLSKHDLMPDAFTDRNLSVIRMRGLSFALVKNVMVILVMVMSLSSSSGRFGLSRRSTHTRNTFLFSTTRQHTQNYPTMHRLSTR